MKFIVIGITDAPQPWFPPEVLSIIRKGAIFSGGRRHHEIVAPMLPTDAQWIDITIPLDRVFEQYTSMVNGQCPIIVFASGDPLFFGFANTIQRKMPEAEIAVYPAFNSLQLLAHRLLIAYHDMRIVSLTGRPWQEFDRALIERVAKIGVLTDKEHTPDAIAQRMLAYGYAHYQMHVGAHLGNPAKEQVTTLSLEDAARQAFEQPNCVILSASDTHPLTKPFGIPDNEFALLHGRERMITKMPIRLLTLQALDLPKRHSLWDIGFCTGSISIEARLQFPHLRIDAFEVRQECETIIQENMRRFGTPGINIHMGDFLHSPLPSILPDAVFIGGHGGKLREIMEKVLPVLADDGCIVMNSVTPQSRRMWDEACQELGLVQDTPLHITLNEYNPITILKCRR